jgi:hypothetical protein
VQRAKILRDELITAVFLFVSPPVSCGMIESERWAENRGDDFGEMSDVEEPPDDPPPEHSPPESEGDVAAKAAAGGSGAGKLAGEQRIKKRLSKMSRGRP